MLSGYCLYVCLFSVCVYVCVFVFLYVLLLECVSVRLSVFCLSVCHSLYLPIFLSVNFCLSFCLNSQSNSQSAYMSVCLPFYLSVSVCFLSVCFSVCLFVCLSVSMNPPVYVTACMISSHFRRALMSSTLAWDLVSWQFGNQHCSRSPVTDYISRTLTEQIIVFHVFTSGQLEPGTPIQVHWSVSKYGKILLHIFWSSFTCLKCESAWPATTPVFISLYNMLAANPVCNSFRPHLNHS